MKVGHGPMRRPAQPRTFISAKEITDRIAQADAAVAAGKNYSGEPLLLEDGHRVTMEWRNVPQDSVHAHVTDAEMFVILDGSGALELGGTLVNPTLQPAGPYEGPTLSAATATGAVEYKVSKGDMIMIPENTGHRVSKVDGKLVLWSMIMPRPATPSTDVPPAPPAAPAPAPSPAP
jgi:mannose-6-phosphate isomerase-like protein (cupin superfamily)